MVATVAVVVLLWIDSLIVLLAFAVAVNPSWSSKVWVLVPILVLIAQAMWLRRTWRRGGDEERTRPRLVLRLALNAILIALISGPVAALSFIP